jgi:iron complex outermembrane recepter protein
VDPKGRDYANRKGEGSRLIRAHRNNNGADQVSCVCFRVWWHAPLLSLVTIINRLPWPCGKPCAICSRLLPTIRPSQGEKFQVKNMSSNRQIRGVVRAVLGGVSTAAVCTPLFAQTAPPADTTQPTDQLQEVTVTGIRASLQRSMDIKQNAIGVVDAISSEDIGQFPDANIGDAIARIPGVTVNRGSLNYSSSAGAPTATGATQGINVRGFGGSFNEVLLEGRPIASGNGQTFNFSDFSSVYVGEVDVLKTPDMSLSTGTVGATINVKFPNPLDQLGPHAQIFGQANDYQMASSVRPGFGALVSDTFFDGMVGILVDGDYLDSHIEGHHQDIVGWKGTNLACSNFAVNPSGSGCALIGPAATAAGYKASSAVPSWYPQDMAMYLEDTDSRRKDGRVAIQFHPSDAVLVTLDDNYSSDDEHDARWQRSTWFGSFGGAVQDGNGTLTNFNTTGPTDFNAFVATNYIVTNTPGVNVKWDVTDHWSAVLDADQSESQYNPNNGYSDIDADTGYGGATNNYTGGLVLNPNGNVLPYWSAYGPNTAASGSSAVSSANSNGLNPFIIGSHVLPLQSQQNTDKINQVKLEVTWKTDDTKVNFGAQFVDDLWNTSESDTFTNNYWQLWSGYGPASGNTVGQALPANLFTQVSVAPWLPGFSGASNLPSSLVKYNPYAVLSYLINQPINACTTPLTGCTNGYPAYSGGIPAEALNAGSVQHVDRSNFSPFVTATQDVKLGDMKLIINAGLRYQNTQETIAGLASPLVGVTWQGAGDPTAYGFTTAKPPLWTEVKESYHYFLPSLDLNLLVTPEVKVRADFSRTEDAPPNGSLIPNTTYGGRVNALTATGNNPGLLPYLSNNFDLGAEWYYAANSYVSLDGFFKHVTNFPTSSVSLVTVPGIIDPAPPINPQNGGPLSNTTGQPLVFSETTVTNALSANVHGVELTAQQMLWLGFGLQVNGTYVHTNKNFDNNALVSNQFALTGVGNSANFIGFYDAHGLQARVTVQWQGTQLLTLGQEQGGGSFGNEPVYLAASTEVDFSTQYQFTSHLSGYFEALNLTDSIYHSYGRFSNQTLNLVEYGRSFTVGFRAKF